MCALQCMFIVNLLSILINNKSYILQKIKIILLLYYNLMLLNNISLEWCNGWCTHKHEWERDCRTIEIISQIVDFMDSFRKNPMLLFKDFSRTFIASFRHRLTAKYCLVFIRWTWIWTMVHLWASFNSLLCVVDCRIYKAYNIYLQYIHNIFSSWEINACIFLPSHA